MSLLGPGQVFANRFEIDRIAGSGGMGTVYRARDRYSGDIVALKLLHGNGGREEAGKRFVREAQLLAELRHPRIVSHIADGLTPDGQRFLAMEWLDGEDLAARLSRGPLPVSEVMTLIRSVADALSAAHRREIVHRDLKPTNLFLLHQQVAEVKILDFGVARRAAMSQVMTQTGAVLGTPGYMAPEQTRGARELLPAVDIFSLGCVLYECLAGEPPFIGEHLAAVLVRILFEDPTPISQRRTGIPASVVALLDQMLKKDPSQRIPDAMVLLERLADLEDLKDVAELQTPPTLVFTTKQESVFAASEQVLSSLVMAADDDAPALFHEEAETPAEHTPIDRHTRLLAAVRTMGVRAEIMANGTLVATALQTGSATDQVVIAARVALLVKERWPEAVVTVATGRCSTTGTTTVGEIAEHAVLLLQRRKQARSSTRVESRSGVWLDELSARLLGPRFTINPTTEGALLIGEDKEVDENRRLLGKPTPCVGRDAELAILEAQLESCIQDGAARLMLMTASPGLGKSRLRHEFLRRVERRSEPVAVLDGRGDLISAGAPYEIFGTAIRRLCGITGSEGPDEQQRHLYDRIARHVAVADKERVAAFIGELCHVPFPGTDCASLLAARQDPKLMRTGLQNAGLDWLRAECANTPVLIILDDLQWSDALTIALFEEALKQLHEAPLFVLAFARPEVHEVFPKLWSGCGGQEYALKPLSKRSCERLIQQVLGRNVPASDVAQAVEQAAGNALFLEEIIRALAEGKSAAASETLMAMLQARVGRMEPGPRRAARAAAMFGQTFWRGGVAKILGLPPTSAELDAWLAVLVKEEMIQPHPSSLLQNDLAYGFRHALIRDAGYSLLTKSDLLTGHRLAAEFLAASEELDSVTTSASEAKLHREALAYHYQQAQMFDAARDTLMRAGESMVRLGAMAEARVRYKAALAMIDKLPGTAQNHRCKVDVLLRLVQTGILIDKDEVHFQQLELAGELLERLGDTGSASADDRLRTARLHYLYGHIHYYRGQAAKAIGYYKKVLPIAQEFGDQELLAVPAYMIGAALAVRGYTNQAEPLLAQAIEPLARYGDSFEWLRAILYYGHALMAKGRYKEGRAQLDRGHARALELNNPELVVMSYTVHCSFFRTCGDWPEVIAYADKAVELANQLGNSLYVAVAYTYQAWAKSYLGQAKEAAACRAQSLAIASSLGKPMILSSWFAAADCEIALNASRYAETITRAQALLPKLKAEGEFLAEKVTERALAVARAVHEQSEFDEALTACLRGLVDNGNLLEAARTHIWWGRVGLLMGDSAVAEQHFNFAATEQAAGGCPYAHAEALRLVASVAPALTID